MSAAPAASSPAVPPNAPVAAPTVSKQSNRLRRKVIRKKAKAAYQDRNSLPLEGLLSSASESIEHLASHPSHSQLEYVPALPVENGNFGTRLSKSA